jgi:DNA-binding PadR family transcriptional regulator
MKIEKYIFHLPEAMRVASVRMDVRPLKEYEVLVLYVIRHYFPITFMGVLRKIESFYRPIAFQSIHNALHYLKSIGFIEQNLKSYSLSPLGREYLSLVRRYLLHKRI